MAAVDITLSDAATTNYRQGDDASAFANIRLPVSGEMDNALYVVLKEDIADDAKGLCVMWGQKVRVNVDNNKGSNAAAGDELWAPNAANFDAVHINSSPVSDAKRVGFYNTDNSTLATGTTAVSTAALFSGFMPIGGAHFI